MYKLGTNGSHDCVLPMWLDKRAVSSQEEVDKQNTEWKHNELESFIEKETTIWISLS